MTNINSLVPMKDSHGLMQAVKALDPGARDQSQYSFQEVKDNFDFALKNTKPEDTKRISALGKLVSAFKSYVLGTFIEKYRPGYQHDKVGVQTLTDDAFDKLGLSRKEYDDVHAEFVEKTRKALKPSYQGAEQRMEYYDWLDFTDAGVIKSSLTDAKKAAAELKAKGIDNAFVMGMGGSSMCPKFLNTAFDTKDSFPIETMDNMDPATLETKLDQETSQRTAFVIISKSGGTFEAAHVIQGIIDHLRNDIHGDLDKALKDFASRAVFITEPKEYEYHTVEGVQNGTNSGTLNKLADELEAKTGIRPMVIDHPPRVGGRFSLFSPVGMFISELKGLKTDEFIKGAEACLDEFFSAKDLFDSAAVKYALLDYFAASLNGQYSARYVMPYGDKLSAIPEFTAQLAGESINKEGFHALNQMWGRGPTSHHSDVEALCRGNLLFEEIFVKDNDEDRVHGQTRLDSLKDYQLKSMHQDMLTKLALPFGKHLRDKKNAPVISTVLDEINEKNMGYLMMRNMLAAAIQAGLQDGDMTENLDTAVRQAEVEAFKVAKKNDAEELGLQDTELKLQVA